MKEEKLVQLKWECAECNRVQLQMEKVLLLSLENKLQVFHHLTCPHVNDKDHVYNNSKRKLEE